MAALSSVMPVQLGCSSLYGIRVQSGAAATTSSNAPRRVTCMAQKLRGTVVSNAMDKTVVLEIQTQVKHRIYSKLQRKTTKYFAHDEDNSCQIGDVVQIVPCAPISRNKRYTVQRLVEESSLPSAA
jgi:small subunit ribosomal protein S17